MNLKPLYDADKKIALALYALKQSLGDLSALGGTVAETVAQLRQAAGSDAVDEEAVNRLIDAKIAELVGGAGAGYDTLQEIEALMKQGDSAAAAVLQEIAAIKQALQVDEGWPDKVQLILTNGADNVPA